MRYIMDTDICIYAIRNESESVIRKTLSQNPGDLCISVVAYVKLVHGVKRSQAAEKNRIIMSLFLSTIAALDFDGEAAKAYGQTRAEPGRRGTPIGPMGLLIAGHARS